MRLDTILREHAATCVIEIAKVPHHLCPGCRGNFDAISWNYFNSVLVSLGIQVTLMMCMPCTSFNMIRNREIESRTRDGEI